MGDVVRSIRETVPGVPVLVIDDCSTDGTISAARTAGAEILPLPHHLGLGGCVQAGYKLAFELGYRLRDPAGWRRPARPASTFPTFTKRCAIPDATW